MRLPKQVLIIPYRMIEGKIEFCVFKRKDFKIWQWVSGGAEDKDEDIMETAKRELFEETGLKDDIQIQKLEHTCMIPVVNIVKEFIWGEDVFYAIEYSFMVDITGQEIKLSDEHEEYRWVEYKEAKQLLKYDSNKSAVWEANEKLRRKYE